VAGLVVAAVLAVSAAEFRWWRSQQQLVASEDCKWFRRKRLTDLSAVCEAAAGANLESVILFGSAVAGDFSSRVLQSESVLCDSRQLIRGLAGPGSSRENVDAQKQPPPLFMTRDEIRALYRCVYNRVQWIYNNTTALFSAQTVLQGLPIPVNLAPRPGGNTNCAKQTCAAPPAPAAGPRAKTRAVGIAASNQSPRSPRFSGTP